MLDRFISLSVAALLHSTGCGSSPPLAVAPLAVAPIPVEHVVRDEAAPLVLPRRVPPVQAGSYRLSMSVRCQGDERIARGILKLERISGGEPQIARGSGESSVARMEGALLWGQTDLDFEQLRGCLGMPAPSSEEPIHPSVLVEVLRWDGVPHHQVILVSTNPRRSRTGQGRAGVGIAMWVESADDGSISGIWSRWELMGEGEGRWHAEVVSKKAP